jgi:hypothetical protein
MRIAALALLIFSFSAQGATNLAIVSTGGAKADERVDAGTATSQVYRSPKDTDLVRAGTGWGDFTWKTYGSLPVGATYDGCASVADGAKFVATADPCSTWTILTKLTGYVATATPGAWQLYSGTTLQKGGPYATEALCVASAPLTAAKTLLCKTSTSIVVTKVTIAAPVVTAPVVTQPIVSLLHKWTPGHYLRSQESAWASQRTARRAYYDLMTADPAIKGGLLLVPWGAVETAKGVYDFSEIDADVAYVKSKGKKLLIEVWWMNFWHTIPSVPQSGDKWLPDYLIAEGGARQLGSGAEGYIAKIDEAAWMDRLIALNNALAARYDANPDVEQLIMTETANAHTNTGQFDRLVQAMGTAWKQTGTVLYANWVDTTEDSRRLAALRLKYGVGFGGPDILPGPEETHDALVSRGAGVININGWTGDYGKVDYRGQVPMSYSYEVIGSIPPTKLIDYAKNTLKATHIAWAAPSWLTPELNWTGVLPVIKANPVLSTACPTAYRCQ